MLPTGSYTGYVTTYSTDPYTATAFVRHGLLPCAPLHPKLAITVRTMEFFRRARLRAPRFSLQAFSAALSDFHERPTRKSFSQQLTVCYDLLIQLRQGVEARVKKALLRDSPNWRLMNACPSCLYKVDDEPPMKYAIHSAIDGNNSLVRVELKTEIKEAAATDMGAAEAASKETEDVGSSEGDGAAASKAVEKTKTAEPMVSIERPDNCNGRGDYILHRRDVDKFIHDKFEHKWVRIDTFLVNETDHSIQVSSGEPEDSGCEDRWHNMVNDMSSKMWGIYKETGIFLGVCRHGMVLLATDMIRSGEL